MVKLIATDMDGTLLDDRKNLSPDFWDVEKQLFDKGILFAVASGRQFHNLAKVFGPTADRTIFIAENGSYGAYQGKELFRMALDWSSVLDFIRIGRAVPNTGMVVSGKNFAYVEGTNPHFVDEVHRHHDKLKIVDDLTQVDDVVLKFTMCDFEDIVGNTYPHFGHLSQDFTVVISGKYWMDITDISANKGTALRRVQEHFGITKDETMVFGDYLNDIQMMAGAKYSYAMKNAHADILKIASHVTEWDNNEYGVTETIKRMLSEF